MLISICQNADPLCDPEYEGLTLNPVTSTLSGPLSNSSRDGMVERTTGSKLLVQVTGTGSIIRLQHSLHYFLVTFIHVYGPFPFLLGCYPA